jgi:beta-lactamase class D
MQRWVDTLAYGNQAIGNAVDQFWLNGTMRISPRQQLELLAKLHLSELPIAPNTRARLLGMFHQATVEGKAIGYKTGLGLTDSGVFTGWYVGHVQGPTGTQVFVALIHGTSPVSASQPDTLQAAIQLRHQFTSAMLRRYLSVDLP